MAKGIIKKLRMKFNNFSAIRYKQTYSKTLPGSILQLAVLGGDTRSAASPPTGGSLQKCKSQLCTLALTTKSIYCIIG